jgi:hypothetical protein
MASLFMTIAPIVDVYLIRVAKADLVKNEDSIAKVCDVAR